MWAAPRTPRVGGVASPGVCAGCPASGTRVVGASVTPAAQEGAGAGEGLEEEWLRRCGPLQGWESWLAGRVSQILEGVVEVDRPGGAGQPGHRVEEALLGAYLVQRKMQPGSHSTAASGDAGRGIGPGTPGWRR